MGFSVKFWKDMKFSLVALSCLMLVSAFAGSGTVTVQAPEYYFTLHAVITPYSDPWWPEYDLYYQIFYAIKLELAKIGINLQIHVYDEYEWWYRVWDRGWNKTWEEGGWDLTCIEWWLYPHALVPWFESLVYSNMTPPEGYNIFPWLDETADKLLWKGMHTFEAAKRKNYLWRWQEWFMHNPPMANLYYPKLYEMTAVWVEGWNPIVRFHDISHLAINESLFAQYAPEFRKTEPNTLVYAVSDDLWSLLPMYMNTLTEEHAAALQWSTLYRWGIKPESWHKYLYGEDPSEIDPTDWEVVPYLAAKDPIIDPEGTGDTKKARVIIRDNVTWSDGAPLTATDVQFTFNTCTLDVRACNTGYGEFILKIENVEYVNSTCVDFILHHPVPLADLKSCLANNWGGGAIMPFHILKGYMSNPATLRISKYNTDFVHPENWLPVTGPFKMVECVVDDHITFERNPNYFGYALGWGPYNINTLIYKWVPYESSRLAQIKMNQIDFGEYPAAPVSEFKEWANSTRHPNVRVFQYDYPAANAIWFNLDHTILSNRYVRLAIAHAIPYEYIFDNILPSWGIETAYRGNTVITPLHYYTDANNVTVHLYNDHLWPYECNITKAQKYMEMWWYSKEGTDHTKGPVGDADFSGYVDLEDFYVWRKWAGRVGPPPLLPGQDEDPDFDNNGFLDMYDFYEWREHWGFYYPEASTTHEWSR